MEMNPPKIASFLPALAEFTDVLTQDIKSGKLDTWEKFSASTQEFYTPAVMKQIETFIPGWGKMASFADGATLVHVTSVLVVLKLTPEYQRATPAEKILFEWIALLHDIAKEVYPGKRDHGHGFRSAIVAGRDLPKLGFPVTSDYEGCIEEWAKLTTSAIRLDADGEAYIQDNRRLPEILAGIDKLFGRNTATSVIVKAVLLHFSIDTVSEWPQIAPLSEAEIKLYLDESFVPYLEIIMLADSDAWSLFDKEIKEKQRQETLLAFQKVRLLVNPPSGSG